MRPAFFFHLPFQYVNHVWSMWAMPPLQSSFIVTWFILKIHVRMFRCLFTMVYLVFAACHISFITIPSLKTLWNIHTPKILLWCAFYYNCYYYIYGAFDKELLGRLKDRYGLLVGCFLVCLLKKQVEGFASVGWDTNQMTYENLLVIWALSCGTSLMVQPKKC